MRWFRDRAAVAPVLLQSPRNLSSFAHVPSPSPPAPYALPLVPKVLTTWQNDLKLWPMANLIGFSLVPRAVRPLYASGVQLLWQCYLSTAGFSTPSGGEVDVVTAVATAVKQPEIA